MGSFRLCSWEAMGISLLDLKDALTLKTPIIFFCVLNSTVASCLRVSRCNFSSTGITGLGFDCGTVHSRGHTL